MLLCCMSALLIFCVATKDSSQNKLRVKNSSKESNLTTSFKHEKTLKGHILSGYLEERRLVNDVHASAHREWEKPRSNEDKTDSAAAAPPVINRGPVTQCRYQDCQGSLK